jgi:NTP-dependent ternary system trypsin peptidase co-occuring protein
MKGLRMVVVQVDGRAGSSPIQVEVAEAPAADTAEVYGDESTRDVREKVVKLTRPLFSEALDLLGSCAAEVKQRLAAMPDATRPDEVELQFAVRLDAKFGAAIVEATSGAQLQVVLRWRERDGA